MLRAKLAVVALVSCGVHAAIPHDQLRPLPQLNIAGKITISGISSGADMAAQLQVAASDIVFGTGVFAGQPYMCAVQKWPTEPEFTCAQQNPSSVGPGCAGMNNTGPAPCIGCDPNTTITYDHCKKVNMTQLVNVTTLVQLAQAAAEQGRIPPLSNIQDARVFLYRGTLDTVYNNGAVNKTMDFFAQLVSDPASQLYFEAGIPSDHCMPTIDPWLPTSSCSRSFAPPAMCNCGYDGAGAVLQHFYQGQLNQPPNTFYNTSNIFMFNQTMYWMDATVYSGLASYGYLYVPQPCQDGQTSCRWGDSVCVVYSDIVCVCRLLRDPSASRVAVLLPHPSSFMYPTPVSHRAVPCCRLHVAFHGCGMGAPFPTMNTSFVFHAGGLSIGALRFLLG